MSCSNPYYDPSIVDLYGNPVPIPCGSCYCCRLDIQRAACDRMFCAWHSHEVAAFVTFTYDDEHLPIKEGFINPTLSKEDLHKYIDNIRHKLSKVKFEYYACGEYGDSFGRPHYHVIFFGLDYQYHKAFFEQTWKKGSVKVLPVTSKAFNYVTKYMTKGSGKDFNDKKYFDYGQIPPFRKMSRGLGLDVYLKHLDEIRDKGFFIFKSRRISVNRYYFNKLVAYSDRQLLNREQSLTDTRNRLTKEAVSHGLDYSFYKHFKTEELEKVLESRDLNRYSSRS